MIAEEIFYFFIFPWLVLILSAPGFVITYLFAGLAAQLLNYLPSEAGKTPEN